MPGLTAIVAAISVDVNAKLTAQGLPPLVDGAIKFGRHYLDEDVAAPRVILIPMGATRFEAPKKPHRSNTQGSPNNQGSSLRSVIPTAIGSGYTSATVAFSAPDLPNSVTATAAAVLRNGGVAAIALTNAGTGYINPPTVTVNGNGTGAAATAYLGPSAEKLLQMSARSLWTDVTRFECHVWGITAPAPDSDLDFDTAQLLYQQVIQSAWLIAPGAVKPTAGQWMDSKANAEQRAVSGRYFIFGLEFETPVLDVPLSYVPVGTQTTLTASITLESNGQTEQGFRG